MLGQRNAKCLEKLDPEESLAPEEVFARQATGVTLHR